MLESYSPASTSCSIFPSTPPSPNPSYSSQINEGRLRYRGAAKGSNGAGTLHKPRKSHRRRSSSVYTVIEYQGIWRTERLRPSARHMIPFRALAESYRELKTSFPFVWRLFLETFALAPILVLVTIALRIIGAIIPAIKLWLNGKILDLVQEAVTARKVDEQELIFLGGARMIASLAERVLSHWMHVCDRIINSRLQTVLEEQRLKSLRAPRLAYLHFSSYPTPSPGRFWLRRRSSRSTALRGNPSGGGPGGAWQGPVDLLTSVGEMATQGFMLRRIAHKRGGGKAGLTVAFVGILLDWLNMLNRRGVSTSEIINEDYLRMQRMKEMATDPQYKQETLTLGLGPWIIEEYRAARDCLGLTPTETPTQQDRQRLSWLSLVREVLHDVPMLLFALQAVRAPADVPISMATINLVQQTTSRVSRKAMKMLHATESLGDQWTAVQSLYQCLDIELEVKDGHLDYDEVEKDPRGMEVEFRDVSFTYPGAIQPALEDINFHIRPGDLCLCVGFNGAGKSSLTKLITRLYDSTTGDVLINGRSIKDYKADNLRRKMNILLQDYHHFPLSVKENILLGDVTAKSSRTDDDVAEASELGGAAEFLEALPQGLDTSLAQPAAAMSRGRFAKVLALVDRLGKEDETGKRRVELSGGQWQKLALSRTFIKPDGADLLVFDEPSASLDPQAESDLFQRLNTLRDSKTTLYITHRLGRFAQTANMIMVFDHGRIIEIGTHRELLEKDGQYASFWRMAAESFTDVIDIPTA